MKVKQKEIKKTSFSGPVIFVLISIKPSSASESLGSQKLKQSTWKLWKI